MSTNLVSTDTPEVALAAQGKAAPEVKAEEQKPAVEQKALTETPEASEAAIGNDTDDDASDESEKPELEGERPKKKSGIQKRIGKLNAKISAAEQEAKYWREQAMKQAPPAEVQKPVTEIAESKPKADDFKTHEEFVEALADYRVEQKLSAKERESKEAEIRASQTTREQDFFKERAQFAKAHDDFDDVMSGVQGIQTSLTVYESILDAGKFGPELLYELAKDPEEYKRICSLPALAAAREIGKFEASLAKSEAPATETKTTKAPKPLKPVGTGTVDVTPTSFETMSLRDYQAWRKKTRSG